MARTSTRKTARKPLTEAQREAKREAAKAKADELHTTLQTQVAALATPEEWTRYLDTMKSFRKYSWNNTILIMVQCPQATRVAGFRQWEKLGRKVISGPGSAIKIFGYSKRWVTKTDPLTGEDVKVQVPYFPVLSVFDVSQTEGEPLPSIDLQIANLNGEDTNNIYGRTEAWLSSLGWIVRRGDTGAADGYTRFEDREIVISETLASEADAAAVLLHEAGHAILHGDLKPGEYQGHRGIWEVEAESVAYVAAGMLGLDASKLSVGYVGSWARGDVKILETTASRVHQAVRTIMDALDPQEDAETQEDTTEAPEAAEGHIERQAA